MEFPFSGRLTIFPPLLLGQDGPCLLLGKLLLWPPVPASRDTNQHSPEEGGKMSALGKTKDELMPWHKPGLPSMGTRSSLFEDWFNSRNMLNADSTLGASAMRVLRQHFTPRYWGFTRQKPTNLIYWVKRLHTHRMCTCVYFCLWYNIASFESKGVFWVPL